MDTSLMPIGLWRSDFEDGFDVSCIFVAFKIKVQVKRQGKWIYYFMW